MIHISGPLGEILHTGDFRFGGGPMLREIGDCKFDILYLDNTFSTPLEDFPPQCVAYKKLHDKIKDIRLVDDKAKIYIYCYTLGKEEVLFNLVKDFGCKVQLLKDRWHRMKAIGICDDSKFTLREFEKTEKISKRERKALKIEDKDVEAKKKPYIFLRAMGNRPQSKEQIDKMKNQYHFIMTGWRSQYNIKHDCYFKIPYSSHSSGRELMQFVRAIKPGKLMLNLKVFKDSPAALEFQIKLISQSLEGQKMKQDGKLETKNKQQQRIMFRKVENPVNDLADEKDDVIHEPDPNYVTIGKLCDSSKLPEEIYRVEKAPETPSTAVQTPPQMAVKDAVTITYIDKGDVEEEKASQENTIDLVNEKASPSGLGIAMTVKKAALT